MIKKKEKKRRKKGAKHLKDMKYLFAKLTFVTLRSRSLFPLVSNVISVSSGSVDQWRTFLFALRGDCTLKYSDSKARKYKAN